MQQFSDEKNILEKNTHDLGTEKLIFKTHTCG